LIRILRSILLKAIRKAEMIVFRQKMRWQNIGCSLCVSVCYDRKLRVKSCERTFSCRRSSSVNPNIRGYRTAPSNQKGGHLVIAVGYNLADGTIAINNPSGFVNSRTQIKHTLSVEEFSRSYAERGIVISPAAL
jgi:hypothetical protein